MKRNIYSIVIVVAVAFLCPRAAFAESNKAQLWITHNFSSVKLLEKEVETGRVSVMGTLRKSAQIKTAYAGGLVTEINALASGKEQGMNSNWFYYVNGIMADVGALGYFPQAGDVVWWDYHPWNEAVYISSVIGSYPQPFLNGYGGKVNKTVVLSTKTFLEKANQLRTSLFKDGVREVEVKEYRDSIPGEDALFIVIGAWDELEKDQRISKIAKSYRKSGFFVKFKEASLQALDIKGNVAREFNDAAVILSIKCGFTPGTPLWLITGTNNAEIENAIELLVQNNQRIKFHSAAIISKDEVFNIPFGRGE